MRWYGDLQNAIAWSLENFNNVLIYLYFYLSLIFLLFFMKVKVVFEPIWDDRVTLVPNSEYMRAILGQVRKIKKQFVVTTDKHYNKAMISVVITNYWNSLIYIIICSSSSHRCIINGDPLSLEAQSNTSKGISDVDSDKKKTLLSDKLWYHTNNKLNVVTVDWVGWGSGWWRVSWWL